MRKPKRKPKRRRHLLATRLLCFALALGVAACDSQATGTTAHPTTSTAIGVSTTQPPLTTSTSTPAGPANGWANLAPAGASPSPRISAALAYDPTAGKTLLFGGLGATVPLRDTWLYDSAANAWLSLAPAGEVPAARSGAALVYCSVNDQMLLIGGYDGQKALADVWDYNTAANAWVELTSADAQTPSPRTFHAVVYLPSRNQLLLFGGMDEVDGAKTYFNDTWVCDCETGTWSEAAPADSAPPARAYHSLSLDPASGKVVLFGGYDGSSYFDDTWVYDPATSRWTDAAPTGEVPAARSQASMVYHSEFAKMVLFGGYDGSRQYDDTWAYDPVTDRWSLVKAAGVPPAGRHGQAMIYDSGADKIILFGGSSATMAPHGASSTTTFLNDTWSYGG
jgi:N-acetylneuraminic acid mutarotase